MAIRDVTLEPQGDFKFSVVLNGFDSFQAAQDYVQMMLDDAGIYVYDDNSDLVYNFYIREVKIRISHYVNGYFQDVVVTAKNLPTSAIGRSEERLSEYVSKSNFNNSDFNQIASMLEDNFDLVFEIHMKIEKNGQQVTGYWQKEMDLDYLDRDWTYFYRYEGYVTPLIKTPTELQQNPVIYVEVELSYYNDYGSLSCYDEIEIDIRDWYSSNYHGPYFQMGWNLYEYDGDNILENWSDEYHAIFEELPNLPIEVYVMEEPQLVLTPDVFYTSSQPLVIPAAGTNLSDSITAKVYSGQTIIEDVSNDISLTRAITFAQAKAASSGIIVRHGTLDWYLELDSPEGGFTASREWSLSDSISIYVAPKAPVGIVVTGTDSNNYYQGRQNTFKTPSGLTLKVRYNDGTEEAISGSVTYKLSSNPSETDLVNNASAIPIGTAVVYVHQTMTYQGEDFKIYGYYTLQYVVDTVTNISLVSSNTIYYGNYLTKDLFTLKATYASGAEETIASSDWAITYPDTSERIMSGFTSLGVSYRGYTQTLTSLSLTFANPTLKAIIVPENLIVAYNNIVSQLDLTNVKLKLTYNNSTFENEVSLDELVAQNKYSVVAQKYSSNTYVNIFATESIDNYNGTTFLDIAELTNGSLNCQFVFSVRSYFDASDTMTKTVAFTVLAMTQIKGIKILNPFTDYRVGDKFLENDEDQTQMVIYWEEQGVLNYSSLPLKSGYASVGIYPQAGTEFQNVDVSKQIQVKSVLDKNVSAEYTISVSPRRKLSKANIHSLVAVWSPSVVTPGGETIIPENGKGVLVLYNESDTTVTNGIRTLSNLSAKKYGYIIDILDKDYQARTVLFEDYLSEIEGSSNAEITFPSYEAGEADLINTCTFGCLFGAHNSVNRLFVSGNETASNADWHSSELNVTDYEYFGSEVLSANGNFSYFTSESIMYYGETDNKVIGYDIVSNDKLLVLKNKSDKEKTVYFRTPTLIKALNAAGMSETDVGGDSGLQEEFTLTKGNNSVAGISPQTIINFNGDTLFVDSDNQISGLDLEGIIGDNQRYANSRSKFIDYKLKDLDLSDAVVWSNNKYLFLSIPNVGLFVTHFEAKTDDQYEWWFITSDNPTVFLEVDDKIYYGNGDGAFGTLQNGQYADITKIFADKDQTALISILPAEERVLIEQALVNKLDESKTYKFCAIPDLTDYTKNIFFEIAKASHTEDAEEIYIDYSKDTFVGGELKENKIYYFNYIEENLEDERAIKVDSSSPLATFGKAYKFKEVSVDDTEYNLNHKSYFLLDASTGNRITGFSTAELEEVSICERLDEDVEILNIDKTRSTLLLGRDGEALNIVQYGIQNPYERNIKAEIKNYEGIEAYYIGAPMLASSINTLKTIWSIILTNDTDIASSLRVAIASNKVPFYKSKDIAHTARGDLGIDFNKMDFARTDFDKKVVPRTYTVNKVLGLQKFLCLAFKNEKGKNAVLSEMAITYTLPFPSYGSD